MPIEQSMSIEQFNHETPIRVLHLCIGCGRLTCTLRFAKSDNPLDFLCSVCRAG